MGRPRKTLPPTGIATIRRLAANGVQETVLAAALGLDMKTWRRIRNEDPEAKAAWEEARALEQDTLVGALFRQAIGAPAEFDDAGNKVRAEQAPNAPAAMFLLKARHGYRDIGPVDGGAENRVAIVVNLPGALQPDQYRKLVEVHPSAQAVEQAA